MVGKEVISQKVQSSTVMEVLISMIVILAVFTIAMAIYSNVVRQSLSVRKMQAQSILREKIQAIKLNDEPYAAIIDSIKVEERRTDIADDLIEVKFKAYEMNGVLLAELTRIVNKDE